jgi:16S rRNA (cytidine1402-2'-O)-methyltransferase
MAKRLYLEVNNLSRAGMRAKTRMTDNAKHLAGSLPGAMLAAQFDRLAATPLDSGLYLVATPIGNLGDMSARALSVLVRADEVYCEDTRHSRKLFSAFGVSRRLGAYHDHSGEREREKILGALAAGRSVALMSDAGTPLISDPGYRLTREALEQGFRVIPIPGPSAAIAALVMSGAPSDRFLFAGFLPPKSEARRRALEDLAEVSATLIFYEAANRLQATLVDMAASFGRREAALTREVTKLYEELRRGLLPDLAQSDLNGFARGEIVIVVEPPRAPEPADDAEIDNALRAALSTMSLRDAILEVAKELGVKRKRVYDRGVGLLRGGGHGQKP